MSNKIWNFDILVDDCFVNFNTKKQEINPDRNRHTLFSDTTFVIRKNS